MFNHCHATDLFLYPLEKKTSFLMFSGSIAGDQWHKISYLLDFQLWLLQLNQLSLLKNTSHFAKALTVEYSQFDQKIFPEV